MKNVAITGLSGVVGNVLAKELSTKINIIDLYRSKKARGKTVKSKKIDLLNPDSIKKIIYESEPDYILHMAAITHIDRCEEDKKFGREGLVWKTNVSATKEIAKFAAKNKIPLFFLSTECVFDGKEEKFTENHKKNPINWYGQTKSEAEDIIQDLGGKSAIIRSVVAFHKNDRRKTIYGKILHQLKNNDSIYVVYDQKFTPTHTYDIVNAIQIAIEKELRGVFHVSPDEIITPFDLAQLIAYKNKHNKSKITKSTLKRLYGHERASLRLLNSVLDSKRSRKKFGFRALNASEVI